MPDRKIINMTPYEVELFSPINMKRVRIPSLGEIRGRASRSAEPDEFYDMSRFRLVSGAVLRSEPYGAGQRCFIEGSGLARIA